MKVKMARTTEAPVLFPIRVIAERWGVSRWTVSRLIASGELASVRIRGRSLVPVDAVVSAEQNGGVGGRKPRAKESEVS